MDFNVPIILIAFRKKKSDRPKPPTPKTNIGRIFSRLVCIVSRNTLEITKRIEPPINDFIITIVSVEGILLEAILLKLLSSAHSKVEQITNISPILKLKKD